MPDISTGTISSLTEPDDGMIKEDGSDVELSYINPRIPAVAVGQRFDFFKIIQNTPNGSKVISILKGKLPGS